MHTKMIEGLHNQLMLSTEQEFIPTLIRSPAQIEEKQPQVAFKEFQGQSRNKRARLKVSDTSDDVVSSSLWAQQDSCNTYDNLRQVESYKGIDDNFTIIKDGKHGGRREIEMMEQYENDNQHPHKGPYAKYDETTQLNVIYSMAIH